MFLRPFEGEGDFFEATVRIGCERGFAWVADSGCFREAFFCLGGLAEVDCCLRGAFCAATVLGAIFLEAFRVLEVFVGREALVAAGLGFFLGERVDDGRDEIRGVFELDLLGFLVAIFV
ncbi:MAG: hypothetical protein OEY80_07610 [Nitrospirota bacterium]|nr:hypothetical protein [Nitrospirota bacterium]